MKVGIVIDTYLPQIGGAEVHVKNLAHFLRENLEVRIFTNTPGENEVDGIKVFRNNHRGIKIIKIFKDIVALSGFVKNSDVVHAHYTFYLSFLSGLLARLFNKPVVVTLHGLGTLDSSVKKSFFRKVFRYFSFKFANAIFATSEEMVEVARRYVPNDKIYLIPNGVDTEYFSPQSINTTNSKFVVLSARRLNPKNGVQYLIEALPAIIKEIPNTEAQIMCKDKLEQYLRQRVSDLGIEKYVNFIGEIPNNRIRDLYSGADVVVFPSSAESTSIACLEAMSMGKAVVASALGVYQQMLGNNERGLLVKLFDRDSSDYDAPLTLSGDRIDRLSSAIISLAKNEKIKKEIGEKAREHVREIYDWNILINRIQKIYFSLLKNS